MYTDEDNNSDMIGAFCELLFPWKGHSNGIIVDDYGTEWLVQLTNGKEVPVYKDEVIIVQFQESPSVAFDIWALFLLDGKNCCSSTCGLESNSANDD